MWIICSKERKKGKSSDVPHPFFLHVIILKGCYQIFIRYEQLPISTGRVFHTLSLKFSLPIEEIWNLF